MKGILKARKAEIPVWNKDNLGGEPKKIGAAGSPTRVVRVWTPEVQMKGMMFEGEPAEVAEKLYQELKKQNIL